MHFNGGEQPNNSFPWSFGPQPNTWFLGPSWVHIPTGILIGSAVFVGLMVDVGCVQ